MNRYFDNAATSWPKPPGVYCAVESALKEMLGNPGRSSGGNWGRLLYQTRVLLGKIFNITDTSRIIFTFNATHAINIALKGLLNEGDRVITSAMEHNAVIRPLRALQKQRNVDIEVVPASPEGYVDPDDVKQALEKPAKLAVFVHASNVCGAVNDLTTIGALVKNADVFMMTDCSQSAGVIDINAERDNLDIIASSGHKGLLGPTGTGFLYLAPELNVQPLLHGGTGSFSENEEQPNHMPDRFESGTQNLHGIAGLKAGLEYLENCSFDEIKRREQELTAQTLNGILGIEGIKYIGPRTVQNRVPVFSIVCPGEDPSDLTNLLEEKFGISTRVGLHCAPWAHKTLGTFPQGSVRVSPGLFHSENEVNYMLEALDQSVRELKG